MAAGNDSVSRQVVVRDLLLQNTSIQGNGITDYVPVWQQMQAFTLSRQDDTVDEIWVTQHSPVFTQGLNGKAEHVLDTGNIPLIQVDRGGQVTYHGPGQLVVYLMLDIERKNMGVSRLVAHIENAVIGLLADYGIPAHGKKSAPGVYVNMNGQEAKIASLGLRVKKGRSYHGVSLNVDMDLSPFERINPCGYEGLPVTQLSDYLNDCDMSEVKHRFLKLLAAELGYNKIREV